MGCRGASQGIGCSGSSGIPGRSWRFVQCDHSARISCLVHLVAIRRPCGSRCWGFLVFWSFNGCCAHCASSGSSIVDWLRIFGFRRRRCGRSSSTGPASCGSSTGFSSALVLRSQPLAPRFAPSHLFFRCRTGRSTRSRLQFCGVECGVRCTCVGACGHWLALRWLEHRSCLCCGCCCWYSFGSRRRAVQHRLQFHGLDSRWPIIGDEFVIVASCGRC